MPKAVFLRSVKLDLGDQNGVHLGFLEYEKDQVVDLSDTSYARWESRGAIAPAETPKLPPAAPVAKQVTPVVPVETKEAEQLAPSATLPPLGTSTKK
jgi:hypothetical protein